MLYNLTPSGGGMSPASSNSNLSSIGLINDINNDNNDEQNAQNSNFQGNVESSDKVCFFVLLTIKKIIKFNFQKKTS